MSSPTDSAERHQRIKRIFAEVADAPEASRDALLEALCGDDAMLRCEVRSLLEHLAEPRVDMTAAAEHVRGAMEAALDAASTEVHAQLAAADSLAQVANFRILRPLGEGGMGVVYLAEQESPRRLVALKLMRPGVAGQQLLRRFRREAEVLGALRHPNIAQIYAAGTAEVEGPRGTSGVPYFAMEFVQGLIITEHCRSLGLSPRERVALLACVCDAVEHAHGRGIIHRDLKPANILVEHGGLDVGADHAAATRSGEPRTSTHARALGVPKILDFGIARREGSGTPGEAGATLQTAVGQVVGTLPYMSPEQLSGAVDVIDRRSDVYALGVILYLLLAGRLPLEVGDRTLAEAARMVSESEPPGLGSIDRSLRGDLDTITAKCLEKDPRRRYQSAAELAADLRRYLEDRPIEARPASAIYQLGKFARRNRGLVAGAAMAFIALVAGTIISLLLAVKAIDARDDAQAQLQETILQSDRSTQAYQILKEIVSQIDPASAGGRTPTIREVLDRARGRLESMSAEEPEVLGMLLAELARGYLRLDELDAADALLAASLRNFRAAPGETLRQPFTFVQALLDASALAQRRGRREEADALRVEACSLMELALRQIPGPSRQAATVHLTLGQTRWDRGELSEARRHMMAGVDMLREVAPDGDDIVAAHELVFANLLMAMGQPREAESVIGRALATIERLRGPDDPETLKARGNLVTAINQAGRFEEGTTLGTALLRDRERLGLDLAGSMATRLNLAFGLLGCGLAREAVPLAREVVAWRAGAFGATHADTARAKAIAAASLRMLGLLDEAETLAGEALRDHVAAHGEDHFRVAEDWLELSAIHLAQGRAAEARADAEAASRAIHAFGGEEHPLLGRSLRDEARARHALGDLDNARALAGIALDRLRASTAPGHPQIADAMLVLAAIELDRGDAAAALALANEALAELRLNSVSDLVLAPAMAMRGAALARLGTVEEGRLEAEAALRLLTEALGPDAPQVREATRWLERATLTAPNVPSNDM